MASGKRTAADWMNTQALTPCKLIALKDLRQSWRCHALPAQLHSRLKELMALEWLSPAISACTTWKASRQATGHSLSTYTMHGLDEKNQH